MKTLLTSIPAFMRLSLAEMLQYRGEIILWAIWGIVYPAVAIAMWGAAVAGNEGGQAIQGFGARDFAAYFLITMIVGHFVTAWDVYEMGHLVRTGALSASLLRPVLHIWKRMADNVAYKVLTLAILTPIWLLVAILAKPTFQTTTIDLILGGLAMLIAAALSFLWGYIVSTAAFWITRTDAVAEVWFGLSLFLGGRLAPLPILPTTLQNIAAVLPFKWIIWFPSEALTGRIEPRQLYEGLAWQMGWLIVGVAAFRFAWKAGVKRYSAVGA